MFKNVKSTYAFGKVNELLVNVSKDKDGKYILSRYDFADFVKYLSMLNEKHTKMVYEMYNISLRSE